MGLRSSDERISSSMAVSRSEKQKELRLTGRDSGEPVSWGVCGASGFGGVGFGCRCGAAEALEGLNK